MRPLAAAWLVLSLAAVTDPSPGQDAVALSTREQKLVAKAVPALHALADAYAAQKQHLRAFELRKTIWLDYAENDEKARDKCGFVKVGTQWRKDAARLVLDKDMKGDDRALKKVEQDRQALVKELVAEHRALAAGWAAAGDPDRATRHWRCVARHAPNDKDAAQALALQPFEGFHGTPTEVAMLKRGRALRTACDWLRRTTFHFEELAANANELLAAAKVSHTGVRTAHFRVWGNLSPAELQTLAMDCERGLLLVQSMFATARGDVLRPLLLRDMVFVREQAQYEAILDQCANQFDAQRLAFLKQDVDMAFLTHGDKQLRVHKADLGLDASRDQAVRGVVQDAVGLRSDGMYEGIGHAACGLLFGKSLTFMTEQVKERTMTQHTTRALVPEVEVWMKIAEESAWSKSDTRTSELVLLLSSRFTNEQRVKAWAICHYLLHWRPDLLHELDQSQSQDIRSAPDVEAEFKRRTGLELPKIDHEWREFWARSSVLRQAMAADPIPEEKSPERPGKLRARAISDAVNAARAAGGRGPAGFYLAVGPDVAAVTKYDQELNKVEAERKKKGKEETPLPAAPPVLGRTVLWSRQKDAPAAVAEWLARPVLRDALVHPGRELFGGGALATASVLDLGAPAVPVRAGLPLCWPGHLQRDVVASVRAGALGPRALQALAAEGKQPDDLVGTPATLHFARAVPAADLAGITCRVFVGNHRVHGAVVVYPDAADSSEPAGDCADGLVAFVPFAPWESKAAVEVQWELPAKLLPKDTVLPPVTFGVQ